MAPSLCARHCKWRYLLPLGIFHQTCFIKCQSKFREIQTTHISASTPETKLHNLKEHHSAGFRTMLRLWCVLLTATHSPHPPPPRSCRIRLCGYVFVRRLPFPIARQHSISGAPSFGYFSPLCVNLNGGGGGEGLCIMREGGASGWCLWLSESRRVADGTIHCPLQSLSSGWKPTKLHRGVGGGSA